MRTVSVGLSRLFRLIEVEGTGYRVEQAVKKLGKWEWTPLAFATTWGEGHGALHQMQADWANKMNAAQESFQAHNR